MRYLHITALIILIASKNLLAAPHCGELSVPGGYGPFDYTNSVDKQYKLPVVEAHHFTSNVEKLIGGSSASIGGDLAYTLRAFPNHHRALNAMARLALREKTLTPAGAQYSVLCFFERAIRFKPNDGMVRMLFGDYLLKTDKAKEGTEQFQIAVDLDPENPTINYNVGLLYMQKKDYEQARIHAKKAYDLGFPLPGLKNQLIKAGKWNE